MRKRIVVYSNGGDVITKDRKIEEDSSGGINILLALLLLLRSEKCLERLILEKIEA